MKKLFYSKYLFIIFVFQFIFAIYNSLNSLNFITNSSSFIYPTSTTYVSSNYGYRDLFGHSNFHNGIDFPLPQGTPVFSTADGIVKSYGFLNGYGISVSISHPNGYTSLYAHLDENVQKFVYIGKKVKQGDIIANVGPKYLSSGVLNGITTGPHLHFTVFDTSNKTIDPLALNLKEKK